MGVDTQSFLNTQQTGALETEYPVVPEGEYLARVGTTDKALELRSFPIQNGERAGQTAYQLSITYELDDADLQKEFGYAPKVRGSIWLDFADEESGVLKMGKGANVQLGRLRQALGQNDEAEPWSPPMMMGQPLYVTVKHREYDGRIFADVKDFRSI